MESSSGHRTTSKIKFYQKRSRRATKHISAFRNLPCDEHWKRLDMLPSIKWRVGWDSIEVFKILNRFKNINPYSLFHIQDTTITRNNGTKIYGNRSNTMTNTRYFAIRIVGRWNTLPSLVVTSQYKFSSGKFFTDKGFYRPFFACFSYTTVRLQHEDLVLIISPTT